MVSTYNLSNAQSVLTDRKTEIDNFNTLIHKIAEAYIHSLEVFENAKDIVKSEYQNTIIQKDMVIFDHITRNKELNDKYKSEHECYIVSA